MDKNQNKEVNTEVQNPEQAAPQYLNNLKDVKLRKQRQSSSSVIPNIEKTDYDRLPLSKISGHQKSSEEYIKQHKTYLAT